VPQTAHDQCQTTDSLAEGSASFYGKDVYVVIRLNLKLQKTLPPPHTHIHTCPYGSFPEQIPLWLILIPKAKLQDLDCRVCDSTFGLPPGTRPAEIFLRVQICLIFCSVSYKNKISKEHQWL
jgi:hypothetical protein